MNNLVGNKIKFLRSQKELSQEQMADYLHISQSAYARMENGVSNSWASHIEGLCKIFDIKPEDLINQDTFIINQNQQGGNSNNAYIINQLSEKLIEQYEARLKEKDVIIQNLEKKLKQNKN